MKRYVSHVISQCGTNKRQDFPISDKKKKLLDKIRKHLNDTYVTNRMSSY